MQAAHTYALTIPSVREGIARVMPFLQDIPELKYVGERRYNDLLVAVTEAVNNAIIHGNKFDPEKAVVLSVRTSPSEVIILVSDAGQGFDPRNIPDPRLPENLLRDGGRGVFLINQLCDVAEFYPTSSGMTVLIKYFLAS
jgi:serine/threonine-protein kinase RsbW